MSGVGPMRGQVEIKGYVRSIWASGNLSREVHNDTGNHPAIVYCAHFSYDPGILSFLAAFAQCPHSNRSIHPLNAQVFPPTHPEIPLS